MPEISSNFFILSEILSEICPKSENIVWTFLSENLMSEV